MKNEKLVDAIGMIKDDYVKEAHEKKKFSFTIPWALMGKIAAGLAVVLLVINILPLGSKSSSAASTNHSYANDYKESYGEYMYDEEAGAAYAADNYSQNRPADSLTQNKKLILTARMNVETKNLDELLTKLSEALNKYGAYIQSSTTSNTASSSRQYDATIRIPSDKYAQFLEELKVNGNVSYYSEETKDVTDTYTDLEARLKSLKAEENKVLEFYDRAESLEDLMRVEERLTEIRYEIEYMEAQIRNYDLLVAYSTLTLHVTETSNYTQTSTSFIERLGRAFKNGFIDFVEGIEDLLITLAYDIYSIIFIILILVAAYFIYKKIRNRVKKQSKEN